MTRVNPLRLSAAALALLAAGGASAARAADGPVKVIASFSILGDMAARVGGDRIELTTLVGPNGDAHVYQPTPADAQAVSTADLVVVNGLGFEGWIDRLVEAGGYRGTVAVATQGVRTVRAGEDAHGHEEAEHAAADGHDNGAVDPHAWQNVENAVRYVANITQALCGVDAEGCEIYRANAAAYSDELASLHAAIEADFQAVPEEKRKVITSHDAFAYFGDAYDIEFLAPAGVSTESEASAADVAALIRQVREEGVTALFVENVADPRLIEQIGRETGVRPGGELVSDALTGPDGPAPTYIDMMRHNAKALTSAMVGS